MTTLAQSRPSLTLAQAQEAARQGYRRLAHDICVQIVMNDPQNEQAWLWRAGTTGSLEERLFALSQVLKINQANGTARQALYETMQRLLRQDAFLCYEGETDSFYYIRTPKNLKFAHPKDRAVPEPFPPSKPSPTSVVFRWLAWSLVGLAPAGLGTLVCAPVTVLTAFRLLGQNPARSDRQRAKIALGIAAALWLLALFLVALLILHL